MAESVVLLAGQGDSTNIVYNALRREIGPPFVIQEKPVPKSRIVRRRVQRIGGLTVLGQVLFMATTLPLLQLASRTRIEQIKDEHDLDASPMDTQVVHVESVNSKAARRAVQEARPSIIVVNGTRIIGKKTLSVIEAPILNMHMGITPLYRGVHGGYWALAENRPDLVGTTIHLIDSGIDTGKVLEHVTFKTSPHDSFATYPYLHLAAGLPALMRSLRRVQQGDYASRNEIAGLPSRLRTHPTIWDYWHLRIRHGAK